MAITFQLPDTLERQLRSELVDLDAIAKEAALVEMYRQGTLTQHQLATALGLDRFATAELLRRHQVTEDLITAAELETQLSSLRKLVGE